LTWSIKRAPAWKTLAQHSVSGRSFRTPLWQNPLWRWELTYAYLRNDPNRTDENGYTQLQSLAGFYLARQGGYDSFLFQDPDDNAVQGQPLGLGDGATTLFQLRRQFGPFTELIQAPAGTPVVYLNGAATTGFTMNSTGGVVFAVAPGSGVHVTADFTFYFPCVFEDSLDLENFMHQLWSAQKVAIQQVRL